MSKRKKNCSHAVPFVTRELGYCHLRVSDNYKFVTALVEGALAGNKLALMSSSGAAIKLVASSLSLRDMLRNGAHNCPDIVVYTTGGMAHFPWVVLST